MNSNKIKLTGLLNLKKTHPIRLLDPIFSKITGLGHIDRLYQKKLAGNEKEHFLKKALKVFKVSFNLDPEELRRIPESGPVIVVSNHPFGLHDALLLTCILSCVRSDYKILANSFFSYFEELKDHLITVNPFKSSHGNNRGLREAVKHLQNGGLLGIFPSGSVSHFRFCKRGVADDEWKTTVAWLVKRTNATVVPLHFTGRNSLAFQLAGMVHPFLRTALLPRESLLHKKKIKIRIGQSIRANYLMKMEDSAMTDYLRMRCYLLKDRKRISFSCVRKKVRKPIVQAIPPDVLEEEIGKLPASSKLLQQAGCEVFCASADQIPNVLNEIGRLREITFREVGEGTGKAIDLDTFDQSYLHLFVWHLQNKEIIGAYRMGRVDERLKEEGVKGLYTNNFYEYTEKFLNQYTNALELGRSFVRKEYQKKTYSLLLLLKGIATYVAQHPHYRYLIGAVSVSHEYDPRSRALISALLQEKQGALKSKLPVRIALHKEIRDFCREYSVETPEDLSLLVKSIEQDGKDIPVLLRHYMRLGARFYSFCIDKQFSKTLDGLIVVDFPHAPLEHLKMYMGKDTDDYLKYHSVPEEP